MSNVITKASSTMSTMTGKSTRRVLSHLLFHSLVCLHHSLIRLLRTNRFVGRALWCAHSFAHSFALSHTHSGALGKQFNVLVLNVPILHSFNPRCTLLLAPPFSLHLPPQIILHTHSLMISFATSGLVDPSDFHTREKALGSVVRARV